MTPWAGDETRVLEIMDWIARGWVEPKCPPEWHWMRVRQGLERPRAPEVSVQQIAGWHLYRPFGPPGSRLHCLKSGALFPFPTHPHPPFPLSQKTEVEFFRKKKWAKKYQKCGHQLKQRPGRIQLKFLDKILGPSPPSSAARCINTASPPSMRYWGLRVSVLL